ncbi:MAG: hypothetical protein LBM28_06605 [Oscillospiraceae bacterium]|nr:hypothetical protein [Oscillospiraceae bacterium]
MRLCELSQGYIESAHLLRDRLRDLRRALRQCEEACLRASLRHRIAQLGAMQQQCYELAELTAHYYERGYYRNENYTL